MRAFLVAISIVISALGFGQEADFYCKEKLHKFPKTKAGPVLEHTYLIENRGTDTLKFTSYKVGCHCTKVFLPEPIAPGKTGEIKLTFETAGKYYQQDRTILLYCNTKNEVETLRFKVFVEEK